MESAGAYISSINFGFWIAGLATAWVTSKISLFSLQLDLAENLVEVEPIEHKLLAGKVKQPEISFSAFFVIAVFASVRATSVYRKFVEISGQIFKGESVPARNITMDAVLSHGARNILASSFLSNGSWKLGKLAGDSLLALDEVGQRTILSVVWAALTWLLTVDAWGANETVGTIAAGLAAFACFFFIRGFLLSFSPYSRWHDLLCGLLVATFQGLGTVVMAESEGAYAGLGCGLCVWLALLSSFILPKWHEEAANRRVPISKSSRLKSIRDLLDIADRHGVDLGAAGFSDDTLYSFVVLATSRGYSGLLDLSQDLVDLVINQLRPASRTKLRGSERLKTFRSLGDPIKLKVDSTFWYDGFAEISLADGTDQHQTFEDVTAGLVPRVSEQHHRRLFLVPNIQHPTIPRMDEEELVPIIVGKKDLSTRNGEVSIDLKDILAVQPYRQLRLLAVKRVDRESYGCLRSLWTCTLEIYLLTVVTIVTVGSVVLDFRPAKCFDDENVDNLDASYSNCDGGWDRVGVIAACYCLIMGAGPPADYYSVPRAIEAVWGRRSARDGIAGSGDSRGCAAAHAIDSLRSGLWAIDQTFGGSLHALGRAVAHAIGALLRFLSACDGVLGGFFSAAVAAIAWYIDATWGILSARNGDWVGHISARGNTAAYRLLWTTTAALLNFLKPQLVIFFRSTCGRWLAGCWALIIVERVCHDLRYPRSAVLNEYGTGEVFHRYRPLSSYRHDKPQISGFVTREQSKTPGLFPLIHGGAADPAEHGANHLNVNRRITRHWRQDEQGRRETSPSNPAGSWYWLLGHKPESLRGQVRVQVSATTTTRRPLPV